MSEEFNKEFIKLSEKDQKSILNLILLKNMNKQTEYKKRIDKALEILHNINENLPLDLILSEIEHSEYILKGENNNE